MELIPQWKDAWRMFSVQASTLLLAWLAVPEDSKATMLAQIPFLTANTVTAIIAISGLIGRLVAQPSLQKGPNSR